MPTLYPESKVAPSLAQIEKAKTDAALGYLATLPPTTYNFQPTAGQMAPLNGGGSTGSGGSGGGGPAGLPSIDWASAFFSSLGLPTDVVNNINKLFTQYSDVNTASAAAIAYIRGTPWYSQTFPGIQTGIKNGLFSDEQGYRDYVNKLNVLAQQYQGRAISGDETTSYIQQGLAPAYVDKLFQSNAYVKANANDIQYEMGAFGEPGQGRLTAEQLSALGKQEVGLTNDVGATLQAKVQKAVERLNGVFQGRLAAPGLTLGQAGVYAPSLAGQKQLKADNNPDIQR